MRVGLDKLVHFNIFMAHSIPVRQEHWFNQKTLSIYEYYFITAFIVIRESYFIFNTIFLSAVFDLKSAFWL